MLALTALIFALWQTPVVVPLKILVVFLHELSHALAAWLTGGSVEQISLSPQQGGFAITRGGNLFAILTAGYLGSLLIGAGLLFAALRSEADRAVTAILGAVMLLVTLLYVRDLFAAVFCVLSGAALLTMTRVLGHSASDMALRVIGLSSLIYVPYDIFDDTIARASQRSDAYMLAESNPVLGWLVVHSQHLHPDLVLAQNTGHHHQYYLYAPPIKKAAPEGAA
ncbi:M50 family metallopeptidase [Sulfitobacter sp.]|nr:M50 family metallopeptidase [Sulfitobacter sp.]